MSISSNRTTILIIALLIVSIATITMISPAEKTLGNFVKSIYLHAAFIWAAIIMFSVAGLLGLIACFSSNDNFYQWSTAIEYTAISIWSINFLFSLVIQSLAWGGIAWNEPRTAMSIFILLFSFILIFASLITKPLKIKGLYNLLMSIIMWFFLVRTGVAIHPVGAISGSPSTAIKAYTLVIALLVLILAISVAAFVRSNLISSQSST